MYARVRELLTKEERLQYMRIPNNLSDWVFGTYFTFTQHDIEVIKRHRRDYNRLGFAVQLCVLRYLGRTLSEVKDIPEEILGYVASQIGVETNEFNSYFKREATKYEHLEEIREEYGYSTFTIQEYRHLSKYLLPHALVNGNALHLIQISLDQLRKKKVILPSMATIERAVWEVRKRAEEKIFNILLTSLAPPQIKKLDLILSPMPNSSKTFLAWLKEVPGNFSPESFLRVIEKLEFIRDLRLQINVNEIHPNRLRQLSRVGARYEPHSFRRFKNSKKYATLVSYLLELVQDLTDQAFEIHDRQIMSLLTKGRKAQEEIQKQNGKSINEKVIQFADLGSALIKARNEGIDPYVALELVMPWEKLVISVKEARQLSRPIDYDYLDLLEKKFYKLRKYTPTLLKVFEFRSTKSAEPLMKAIEVVRGMNDSGKRKVPDGSPLDFVSNRWQKHVYDDDGTINRHYYEMAVLTELRNFVRSGDVSIVGSRQYKDFDEYLVSTEEWEQTQPDQTKLFVSFSEKEYINERTRSLHQRLEWISNNFDKLEGVNWENGRFRIDRLEKDVPSGFQFITL